MNAVVPQHRLSIVVVYVLQIVQGHHDNEL